MTDQRQQFEEAAKRAVDEQFDIDTDYDKYYVRGFLAGREHAAPKWIDVKERLPKPGEDVLTLGGIAYINGDGTWYTITGCDYPGRPIHWEVTHYMPLPSPPSTQNPE